MPKQFYKLNDFSGGLNLIRDARDIAPNELTQANNLSLGVAGSIRTANELNGTDGAVTPHDNRPFPGGGLFYYETDKAHRGANNPSSVGERWTATLDAYSAALNLTGIVKGDVSVVDMGVNSSQTFATNELKFENESITSASTGTGFIALILPPTISSVLITTASCSSLTVKLPTFFSTTVFFLVYS